MTNCPLLPLEFKKWPLRPIHSLEHHEISLPRGGNRENQPLFPFIDSLFFLGATQRKLVRTDASVHYAVLLGE